MPQYIIKLSDKTTDYYLIWSTVVDAPVTYGQQLEYFKRYYKKQYGEEGMKELVGRLERVEKTGISAHPPFDDLDDLFLCNRAGDNETKLSKKQIIAKYCTNSPINPKTNQKEKKTKP